MAHHQHHGADYDAQMSRSLQTRPAPAHATSMPSISEDELLAETDEPPDPRPKPDFSKHTLPPKFIRRSSLLTQALHTDSESHDEDHHFSYMDKLPSVSSTGSAPSARSAGDFTSDDGHMSPSTRASTPGSPRSIMNVPSIRFPKRENSNLSSTESHNDSDEVKPSQPEEASVEAKLGRKRCIMFACGRKDKPAPAKEEIPKPVEKPAEPAKRPCMIKFACPFKANRSSKPEEPARTASRHLSPAPGKDTLSPISTRRHRDSDSTIRQISPTSPESARSRPSPRPHIRRLSSNNDIRRSEGARFHEFASEEEEHEDWTQETTCHRSRLTVNDTLKKELDIRKLVEECEEENAAEEDEDEDFFISDDEFEAGFQTDDEEGFAESDDDEEEGDSDYEWWAPRRKSAGASPYVSHREAFRPTANRTFSDSSIESSDGGNVSPKARERHNQKRTKPLPMRSRTPELPDSTDFVCGTLDEDRPMEQKYVQHIQEARAAKHKIRPQDIDPTFPLSDPEMASENEEEDRLRKSSKLRASGARSNVVDDEESARGRHMSDNAARRSPNESPKRAKSPMPKKKSCVMHRSPAPQALFSNRNTPRRMRSPPPAGRLTSPPPSRRGSTTASPQPPTAFGIPFLSTRTNGLTHTASLPRSPHPFHRRAMSPPPPKATSDDDENEEDEDEDDSGSATDKPSESKQRYARGAIDIAQGLERKRLKRREKFYKQYQRKQECKERKARRGRPEPGKGAERMRQIGIECAVYRGTRMLSI